MKYNNIKNLKEQLEKEIGYEIQYFKIDPILENNKCVGYSVRIIPLQKVEKIIITGIINENGINIDEL